MGRVPAADSAPPALASGSGSDSELCDAIGDSGDIAADGAATDDAEEEPSPVDLDSILGNQISSGQVAADKDGEEADDVKFGSTRYRTNRYQLDIPESGPVLTLGYTKA